MYGKVRFFMFSWASSAEICKDISCCKNAECLTELVPSLIYSPQHWQWTWHLLWAKDTLTLVEIV